MFSLGMSIDSLSKSIYCNLNNNIACYNVVTYTATLYNHTIPNKGSQVIDSPDLTFEGLRCGEIEMVSSYKLIQIWKFQSQRHTLKSKNPRHPSENRVNYYRFFTQKIYAYRKSLLFFILLGGTVLTIVLPKQTHFLKLPYSIWLCRSCGSFLHGWWHFNDLGKL